MRKKFPLVVILVLGVALQGCSVLPSSIESVGLVSCEIARVKDGDSVLAECNGDSVEIRLSCIDAPELSQKHYGAEAKRHLSILLGKRFEARYEGVDRYNRTLATLWRDNRDVNLEMVRTGQALVYRKYCDKVVYLNVESDAELRKRGVWDGEQYFVPPWEWRRR